jgi:hypothetical protein
MMAVKLKKQGGSVLVMAVVLSLVASFAGISFLTFAVILHNQVNQQIENQQTRYERYIDIFRGALGRFGGHLDGLSSFSELGYGPMASEGTSHTNPANGHSDSPKPMMNERQVSFADFLYLSNRERDPLRGDIIYLAFDTLNGWVHSNDTIHVANCPVFLGRVTSPGRLPNCPMPPGSGFYPAIHFPDGAEALRYYSGYNWGTQGHDSLTQIVLSGSDIYMRKCGKVRVNGVDKIRCSPNTIAESSIFPIPPTGAIFVNGKVWVSASRGRVDIMDGAYPESLSNDGGFISQGFSGKLTIGSSDTLLIVDDLIYQHSRADNSVPSTMDSCSDILGLVSENYVMMGRMVRDTAYVNAGIATLRGAFTVQDIYRTQDPGLDNVKDLLLVWGSIAQYNRGLIHSFEPNGHERGFLNKHYYYDQRFLENRPLAFPGGGKGPNMRIIEMPNQDGQS